jgi:hypothetical protein
MLCGASRCAFSARAVLASEIDFASGFAGVDFYPVVPHGIGRLVVPCFRFMMMSVSVDEKLKNCPRETVESECASAVSCPVQVPCGKAALSGTHINFLLA